MNSLRKVLGFLMAAAMLAAFALPASAAQKSISLLVTPATLPTGTSAVSAKITNTGNSNSNSFEVDWTTPTGFTVNSASVGGTTVYPPFSQGLKGAGYSRAIFTQQLPNKTSVTITLNVTVDQCAPAASVNWFAFAWTGAPGPASQSFTLAPGPYTTTLPAGGCTIEFVNQPKDAFIGSLITNSAFNSAGDPVSVQLQQNGAAPPTTTVSVSATPACAIEEATAETDEYGIATFPTLTSTALDTQSACQLTASAPGYGAPATSDSFRAVESDGILGCGDSTGPVDGTEQAPEAQATGTRLDNANGGCGDDIPYTLVWRDIDNGQELLFLKDDLGQAVAMTFKVTWPNEPAPTVLPTDTNPVPTYGVFGAIKLSQQEFVPGEPVPIDSCVGTPTGFVADPDEPGSFLITGLTGTPAGQYGCAYERRITNPAFDTIGLREWIYLQGDWGASRAF